MHTVVVILIGFALLSVCLLASRLFGGASLKPRGMQQRGLEQRGTEQRGVAQHDEARRGRRQRAKAALVFIPLWLVGAAINLWIGVSRAGYSVAEELPIFLVVFAIPALVAVVLWRRWSRSG